MPSNLEKHPASSKDTTKATYPTRLLAKLLQGRQFEKPITGHHVVIGDSRFMPEVPDESVELVVTSPPYPMIELWDDLFLKMGCQNFDEMHDYLAMVWAECYRALTEGGIACINIGDALRKGDEGFRLYPNHVRITEHCEAIGFTSLPYILWQKPTRKPNAFLGSGFLPPNAYVTLDCEFILLFRKGAPRVFPPKDLNRYASHYTKAERDTWFTQIWRIPGARQKTSRLARRVAAFPEEIVYRLVRMFSILGDTVIDPFLGTGTTMKVAMALHRSSIGYEIDEHLIPIIKEKLSLKEEDITTQQVHSQHEPTRKKLKVTQREDRLVH